VAAEYRRLLLILDMPISSTKTHTCNHMYEFAKRWVYHGKEVTGFSISGFMESWKKYPLLHNFLQNQSNHGWELSFDRHPGLIRGIYSIYGKPSQVERVLKLYSLFDALIEIKQTRVFNIRAYKALVQYFGLPEIEEARALTLVESCLKQVRIQMLNSDLEKYQTDISEYLYELESKHAELFPGLDTPLYREQTWAFAPTIKVGNDRIDSSIEIMMVLWNPDATVDELYNLDGLAKWSISRRIFSMRATHAHQLNTGRMVKAFITEVISAVKDSS